MYHRLAYRPVWWRHFHWESLFPDGSGLCGAEENPTSPCIFPFWSFAYICMASLVCILSEKQSPCALLWYSNFEIASSCWKNNNKKIPSVARETLEDLATAFLLMSSLSPSSLTCVPATFSLGWSGGVCFLTTQSPKAGEAKEMSLLPVGRWGGLLILPFFLPDSLRSHSVLTRSRSPGLNCVHGSSTPWKALTSGSSWLSSVFACVPLTPWNCSRRAPSLGGARWAEV